MKKMIMLFILCFSFSFAGTVWVAAGTSASVGLGDGYYGGDVDLDDSGLEIGFTNMLKQDGKMGTGIGGSYHLAAMGEDGFEAKFLTLYGLGTYSLSNEMVAWFGLGLGLPQGDIDEGDAGLAYSFGVMYNLNEKMMFGLGYTVNNTSISEFGYSQDYEFSRMTFNFGYRM